jgi:hypothetical protein
MTSVQNGIAYIYPNTKDVQPNGRSSVRLTSNDVYTEVLIIGDFTHVPAAICGTWPAFWTANLHNWPSGGEIDIMEGVNQDTSNHVALHTTAGCVVSQASMSGTFDTTNCDVNAAGQATNAGCGGYTLANGTYGNGLNNLGGGIYAVDWTAEAIRVYQFARSEIPSDILAGAPNPALWGEPAFDFSGSGANIPAHFNSHQIVFDMTYLLTLQLY